MRAWILRRQGRDAETVVLRRGRIYILPTQLGVAYAAMVFAMLVGGLNYGNNLGLAFAFLLAGVGLTAMHHCHGTLEGLALARPLTRHDVVFDPEALRYRDVFPKLEITS